MYILKHQYMIFMIVNAIIHISNAYDVDKYHFFGISSSLSSLFVM